MDRRDGTLVHAARRVLWIETTLSDAAIEVGHALGIEGEHLRDLRTQHGAVEDRYDGGKVLFVDNE